MIIGKKKPLPTDTYDSRRRQYYSGKILFGLKQFKRRGVKAVLGFVDVDLYVRGLNNRKKIGLRCEHPGASGNDFDPGKA